MINYQTYAPLFISIIIKVKENRMLEHQVLHHMDMSCLKWIHERPSNKRKEMNTFHSIMLLNVKLRGKL